MHEDSERRSHIRFPFSSRLEVRQRRAERLAGRADFDIGHVAKAVAIDVSVSGLGFMIASPLAVGDLICISLPYSEQVLAQGFGEASVLREPTLDEPAFEVHATVRYVKRQGNNYVIGAERRADA